MQTTNTKINHKLKSELSILVNNFKTSSKNTVDNRQMKQKIKQLQKQQHLLLQRILSLSKMI
jgi:hypothetical protein